jgi:hypothetical protein
MQENKSQAQKTHYQVYSFVLVFFVVKKGKNLALQIKVIV